MIPPWRRLKKTEGEVNLKSVFDSIFNRCARAFKQKRTMARANELAHGLLTCTGRATITGMLIAVGRQFVDWAAAYRLFWGARMDTDRLFDVSLQVCLEQLGPEQVIVGHMDDTVIRKVGKTIAGTGWRRDPLGPAFHTNFIWAQRFIQISLSLHDQADPNSQSRAIAVDFHHSPSVKKPAMHAFVHLAGHIHNRLNTAAALPKAKWERKSRHLRPSTNILNNFRGCYVFEKLEKSFSDFVAKQRLITNAVNPIIDAVNPLFLYTEIAKLEKLYIVQLLGLSCTLVTTKLSI